MFGRQSAAKENPIIATRPYTKRGCRNACKPLVGNDLIELMGSGKLHRLLVSFHLTVGTGSKTWTSRALPFPPRAPRTAPASQIILISDATHQRQARPRAAPSCNLQPRPRRQATPSVQPKPHHRATPPATFSPGPVARPPLPQTSTQSPPPSHLSHILQPRPPRSPPLTPSFAHVPPPTLPLRDLQSGSRCRLPSRPI
jgi:hypothetical protein